jgi:hypothetical protein
MNETEDIDPNIYKIIDKLLNIGRTKSWLGIEHPYIIQINEFKHLISNFKLDGNKIKSKNWLKVARKLESMGVLKYHSHHFLELKLNSKAFVAAYNFASKPYPKKFLPSMSHKQKLSKRLQ